MMNYIAQYIVDTFAERFPDDQAYVSDKSERLKDTDKFGALLYVNELDGESCSILAQKLGVDATQLQAVAQFLRQL